VNKRVRSLEESGYTKKAGARKTKAEFETTVYELTSRAYLAILLNSTNLEGLVKELDEEEASAIMATIASSLTATQETVF
jgi:hypothetical protein